MDLFSLENTTALVTGGTRGIGQQMAIALAEAGSDVILVQVSTITIYCTPTTHSNLYLIERHFQHRNKTTHRIPRPQSNHLHRRPLLPRIRLTTHTYPPLRRPRYQHSSQLRRHPTTPSQPSISRQRLGRSQSSSPSLAPSFKPRVH